MRIELLHVNGCPNLEPTRLNLQAALRATGSTAVVTETEVTDLDTAISRAMPGSPTVVIDGVDAVEEGTRSGSLSCRLYCVDGALQGAPSVDQLTKALTR